MTDLALPARGVTEPVKVTRLVVGPLGTNAYLLRDTATGAGAVIDPGGAGAKLAKQCRAEGIVPHFIIVTHAHVDHIAAVADLKDAFPQAQFCAGAADAGQLLRPTDNLSALFGIFIRKLPADMELKDGQQLQMGQVTLRVIGTPGHTPGSISLLAQDQEPWQLFCGDLIFRGGVGRVDLPGGNAEQLCRSIREKVLTLPDQTVLWPGHGEPTTVSQERVANPFLAPGALLELER